MKNLILFLTSLYFLSACSKATETPAPTVDNATVVPDKVVKAITNNFADASSLAFTTLKINDLYSADFKSNQRQHTAVVSSDGTIKELTIQATTLVLPASVTAYITANYPNATIVASFETYTPQTKILNGYIVHITTTASKKLALTFNLAGVWLSTIELPPAPVISKYVINTFAELPQNIQNLLTTRHTGLVFYSGTGVVIDNVTTYYVSVKVGDMLHNYTLNSNADIVSYSSSSLTVANGTTTQKSLTSASDVPPVIATYLTANFVGWQFLKGIIFYDNTVIASYLIVCQVGTDLYYISFNATGGFTGAKKG